MTCSDVHFWLRTTVLNYGSINLDICFDSHKNLHTKTFFGLSELNFAFQSEERAYPVPSKNSEKFFMHGSENQRYCGRFTTKMRTG